MARLIEFFSRTGELVLDPFAGVGGTLLGAAIARGPRRAIGIELDPRWAAIFDEVVRDLSAERDGLGPELADLGTADPGGPRPFDPSGLELRVGDALAVLPTLEAGSIDFVATDPPYNLQLPMTMAGGVLAETHANRRTDYAMVTDSPADLANAADYPAFLDRMEVVFGELHRVLRDGPLRGGHRPRRLPGRALRVHRLGPGGAGDRGRASCPRATSSGTRRGRGCGRTAIRGRSSRTSSTSTSWCCARSAAPSGLAAARLEVGVEDVAVDVGSPIVQLSATVGIVATGPVRPTAPSASTISPRVILCSQPCWPSGHRTSQ